MQHVLAHLDLIEEAPNGKRAPLRIEIEYPQRNVDGFWTCKTNVTATGTQHKVLVGADALQSLCFAIRYARLTLELTVERGRRLLDSEELSDINLRTGFGGLTFERTDTTEGPDAGGGA